MKYKLNSCPFCSGEAKVYYGSSEYRMNNNFRMVFVRCKNCGAQTQPLKWIPSTNDVTNYYKNFYTQMVVDHWNRRTYESY